MKLGGLSNLSNNFSLKSFFLKKMAARKSTRVNKGKWPCGTCGHQCIDNSVFCEGCGVWHHAKCDRLSKTDLGTLKGLTEDYLCSSCTHVEATTSQQLCTDWRSRQNSICWKMLSKWSEFFCATHSPGPRKPKNCRLELCESIMWHKIY